MYYWFAGDYNDYQVLSELARYLRQQNGILKYLKIFTSLFFIILLEHIHQSQSKYRGLISFHQD